MTKLYNKMPQYLPVSLLDDKIMDKIKNCDSDKKQRIFKMIDIL